ncbi:MAG: hypothetical protein C5S48_03945 [Candidatus Methanogaster sp.]|nr:MAG: hypothetical protein C5S48_03945 [ANME-2 cluster archaeon]
MAKPIIIFVGSPNVGSYINVMAHSIKNYGVNRIVLVNLLCAPSGQQVDFEKFVNADLWKTISEIAYGRYNGEQFELSKDFRTYENLKKIYGNSHDLREVNYQFLSDGIKDLQSEYGSEAIVDLSAVPKRVAIDVLTGCLAVGLQKVTVFELKKTKRGLEALYHTLNESDYEHVVLPNWEPFLDNLESFAARRNRLKLWTVVGAITISLLLTILYQIGRIRFGEGSWYLVGTIVFFGFLGGILPILDAWGGIKVTSLFKYISEKLQESR